MSRCCEITITVDDYDEAIVDAVADLGYEADYDLIGDRLEFCSEVINITAGLTEESVAREIVEAIWKANGAFCKIQIEIRDLDTSPPCYSWGKAAFDAFHKGG